MSGESIASKVIEYLKWHPNAKPSEIADYLGVSPRLVRAVLARLRAKGVVSRTEKGYVLRVEVPEADKGEEKEVGQKPLANATKIAREGSIAVEPKDVLSRLSELEKRVESIEKAVNELRNAIPSKAADKNVEKTTCREVYEAIELVKMGLESIRLGDQHSLDSVLNELENVLERLRKCLAS